VFRWVGCVAYAILAALIVRMIVLPVGPLEATSFGVRIGSAALGIAIFYILRRNSLAGVTVGCGALAVATLAGL
jgi:branched-subunit amino acid transport protein